jgi:uncharacterized protein
MSEFPAGWLQGVDEFNRQEYYACHDTLEALWMDAAIPDKNFYQGVLQIAVGCYHLHNLNLRGAIILLGEGIGRLSYYQPVYEGIDVSKAIRDSSNLLQTLQSIDPNKVIDFVTSLQTDRMPLPILHWVHQSPQKIT